MSKTYSLWRLYRQHYRSLIHLGIPIIMGQLAMVVLSFFDTLMVGQYGTRDLAAASFTVSLVFLPLVFLQGIAMGVVPFSGAAFGKKDTALAGFYLKNSISVAIINTFLCILLMIVLYFFLPYMGQDPSLLPLINPLYIIYLFSMPFAMIFNIGKQFTDSITQTRISMYVITGGVLFNIIFNYLLIYGIGPFPELGVIGAGIATLIARILMGGSYLFIIIYNKDIKIYFHAAIKAKWNKKCHVEIQKMGWPIATQLVLEGSGFVLTTIIAGWISTTTMAAHQIMLSLSQVFFLIFAGIGMAITVRVSNFNGQKKYKSVRNTVQAGYQMILAIVLINIIIIFSLRGFIGKMFTSDQEILKILPPAMIFLAVYQIADASQMTFISALRGIGRVKIVALTSFVSYILISLPISYFMGITFNYGLAGIWTAFPISLSIAAIIYYRSYINYLSPKIFFKKISSMKKSIC